MLSLLWKLKIKRIQIAERKQSKHKAMGQAAGEQKKQNKNIEEKGS